MDPTVGACLLSSELASLHAAKLYVIQQAAKETQPATDNSDSTIQPALLRLEHTAVLQKFTFLALITNTHVSNTQGSSPQEQLD